MEPSSKQQSRAQPYIQKRNPKEFPESSLRIPKKIQKKSKKKIQRIPQKFPKNSQNYLNSAYISKSFSSLFFYLLDATVSQIYGYFSQIGLVTLQKLFEPSMEPSSKQQSKAQPKNSLKLSESRLQFKILFKLVLLFFHNVYLTQKCLKFIFFLYIQVW